MFKKVKSIVSDIKSKNDQIDQVLFVGCGASMSDLYPSFYFLNHESSKLRTSIHTANEFVYDTPKSVGENTIVVTASFGGTTPESVAATKKAIELGANVVSLTHYSGSPIDEEAEYTLIHGFEDSYAAKTEKMTLTLALAVEIVNEFEGYEYYEEAERAFEGIYNLINTASKSVAPVAEKFAQKFKNADLIYVLGSGASLNVAYSTASFLFMEMQWIAAPSLNSGEYFHGPFEMTEKGVPYLLFMNDGPTRSLDARALTFLQRFDANYVVVDAKDFGLNSVAGEHVIDYFNPILLTGVFRQYAEYLADARKHPLTKRRYMWKLTY